MYNLTNTQTNEVTKIENIFDVMSFLNGGNYDRLKSVTKPEVVYNMLTNYDRHTHSNLVQLAKNGGLMEVRGQKNFDVRFEANAELIAEAFNVTNESGFTPSELLAQRNELVNLVLQISTCETPKTISGLEHLLSSIKNNAIKVLSKCTMVCS